MSNSGAKTQIVIRSAQPEDAAEICRVHYLSVTGLAAGHYTDRQIELWTAGMTPEVITSRIPAEGARCLVVQSDEKILGFGIILGNEIRAVYVRPDAANHGLGRKLLNSLEKLGKSNGEDSFILNASLNAQGFYESMGYTVQRKTIFNLVDNGVMACVVMKKYT